MNKKLIDILVCPFDKVSSLELFQFKSKANSDNGSASSNMESLNNQNLIINRGENYQDINKIKSAKNYTTPEVSDQSSEIVEEGLLLCRTCLRFYPITEEIPIILPDELRDKKKDTEFLQRWNESIPRDLLKNLKPWTL